MVKNEHFPNAQPTLQHEPYLEPENNSKKSGTMNRLKVLILVSSLLVSSSLWAESGGDRVVERMENLRNKAEAVLIQAERAPEGQRHVHMAEHMNMLGEIMSQLHQDHPDASMSPQQHLAWMEKHDKIVDDVLSQMQREHKLMLSENHQ